MATPLASLRALALDLLDLFAPRTCAACAAPHPTHPREHPAPVLCAPCAGALVPPDDVPRGVLAPYALGGPLTRAIHRAKYGDSPGPARQLGVLLAHAMAGRLPPFDRVVPVPLHPQRLATRGFNQAVELARAFGAPIAYTAVQRVRDTPSQVGLGREARLANVADAFVPRHTVTLRDARVLIVDDVVTTGATLAQVARAVRAAGAREVHCLALARAPLET